MQQCRTTTGTFLFFFLVLVVPMVTPLNPEDKPLFNPRRCREDKWKGDIGDLPPKEPGLPRHPRNIKILSRKKRFVAFPKGSTLTVKNELNIIKYKTDWKQLDFFIGLPFMLDLPDGHLRLIGKGQSDYDYDYFHHDDNNYNNDNNMAYSRHGRSLTRDRKVGFDFLTGTLQSMGLPGKVCLLKAVCESAESPVASLGLLGELLTMFLSAGYGERMNEMRDFVEAEELGRRNRSCENTYKDCPFHLMDFLESGLSLIHSGVTSASYF